MTDVSTILADLKSDSAKRRERVIQNLTASDLQDARVLEQLQSIVSADPTEYVRDAARAQLTAAGQTPRASIVPVQVKKEGTGKPATFAIGGCFAVVALFVCIAIVMIAILAILGPQIGNVFSRVTNGLGNP